MLLTFLKKKEKEMITRTCKELVELTPVFMAPATPQDVHLPISGQANTPQYLESTEK